MTGGWIATDSARIQTPSIRGRIRQSVPIRAESAPDPCESVQRPKPIRPLRSIRADGGLARTTDGLRNGMHMGKHRHLKHGCGQPVLAALDHWACAIPVTCDPWPLSPAGEVEALRDGRQTYQIRQWGVRHRNAYRIADNPPRPGVTVVAEHRCGEVVPDDWKQPLPPAKPRPTDQEVPY
jgi:hypothetical protein